MKFRRGIAKLLVAVIIVELFLSSINRNEYMVMAATDETMQSEATVLETTEEESESTMEEIAEETLEETTEENSANAMEETTEEISEITTEQTTESATEETTGENSEITAEETTEEDSESTTKEATGQAAESIAASATEDSNEEVQDGLVSSGDYSIQRLSEENETESSIPTDPAELDANKEYSISTYQDWLNLQTLSQKSSLEEYVFRIYEQSVGNGSTLTYYDLTSLTGFKGLGTEQTPFSGTLYTYQTSGVSLKTNKPIFKYLSTKANLNDLLIAPSGACAGLAENLLVESQEFGKLNEVIISGINTEISGAVVGGLFAKVINEQTYAFELKGSEVEVKASVSGSTAGGLIGSMTGSLTLVMDEGIKWAPSVEAVDTSSIIGGWIGSINAGNDTTKGTVTIKSVGETTESAEDTGKEIIYNFQGTRSSEAEITGGLFGKIENAEVIVENNLTINQSRKDYDLVGLTAGSFAGIISNTNINLKANVNVNGVRIQHITIPTSYSEKYGIGGFVGVVIDSKIDSLTDNGNVTITGVYVQKGTGTSRHNIGGLTGYAYNSYFLFTNAKCTVENFSSRKTYGQVAGAIGLYEADNNMEHEAATVIQRISVIGTTTVTAISGNVAGLIGKIILNDCSVTVKDCYGENLCYAGGSSKNQTNVSLGIGKVESTLQSSLQSSEKLYLTGIVLTGALTQSTDNSTQNENFGGMIGWVDTNLEIAGTVDDNGVFDTAVSYAFTEKANRANYFGGLIGAVCQSSEKYREIDISNVLIGSSCSYYSVGNKYAIIRGGLLGIVGDKTSVCLDEKIYLIGGYAKNWEDTSSETETKTYTYPQITNYAADKNNVVIMGSVVGNQNYSLIYLQPTAELKTPNKDESNEIGNYGGIFRNGNWDTGEFVNGNWIPEDNDDEDKWLIQNHQVFGSWKSKDTDEEGQVWNLKIENIGDFMRLAILGNTYNLTDGTGDGFYPETVDGENADSSLKKVEFLKKILSADFYLDSQIYDLSNTGIVSLYRNDNEAMGWAQNSLICEDSNDGATIKYQITNYSQPNLGLFPGVTGEAKKVEFRNLKLNYIYKQKTIKYGNGQGSTNVSLQQFIGGLSSKAKYEIEVSNVKCSGSIIDNREDISPQQYIGGLFGYYTGTATKTLSVNSFNSGFNCSYMSRKACVGAVIAWVQTTDYFRCNVSMDTISVTGAITATYTNSPTNLQQSGLITWISSTDTKDIYSNFNISKVTMGDISLGAESKTVSFPSIGGFLGYSWNCVKVNLSDINIGTNGAASISTKTKSFGGLVHDIRGKVLIKRLEYGAATSFDTNNGEAENCGLLVQNGQYLYLDVAGYSIDEGVRLLNYTGDYFDELVGYNKYGDSSERGGIVSISTNDESSYLGKGNTTYNSYGYGYHVKDGADAYVKKLNPYTRYYYDLDEINFGVDYSTIDSANDLMVWHIMHYANAYIIDECFVAEKALYSSNNLPKKYEIKGEINMTGYSIYPTSLMQHESYQGTDDAKIIFNAQAIYKGENELLQKETNLVVKYPKDVESQHYLMHGGLFNNIWNGVDVSELALSGTYSIQDRGSSTYIAGALVCGTIYGVELEETGSQGQTLYDEDVKSNFNNITLDDLWCVSAPETVSDNANAGKLTEATNLDNAIGLMIANITSGAKVNMDGIIMQGYDDDDVSAGYKAASALIGLVGDENATYISLTFNNMDIMDAAANRSNDQQLNSTKCEEALARASFIYYYNYKENCSAIYTFTSKDYLVGKLGIDSQQFADGYTGIGAVTLGIELGEQTYSGEDGTETTYAEILYYDNDDPVGKASKWLDNDGNAIVATEIPFACANYLPYVYSAEQDILVNPKIADIKDGCGTYEDPYIISTSTQLITLYRYLYEEELYKEVLGLDGNEWQIHATGDGSDSVMCNGTEENDIDYPDSDGHGQLLSYGKEGTEGLEFPTKEELSQAYYMITDDIDLSKSTEFIGFGREEMPFIGVFVGQQNEDKVPTITMLQQNSDSYLSQYAFIQVAKGVVVKDLTFSYDSTVNVASNTGGIGAGVIATVAGGDNIIDNVTVQSRNRNACFAVTKSTAVVGGYVGVVELGGVILRNMNGDSLSGFSVETDGDLTEYPYLGSIIGRVLDGYVVYDGQLEQDIPLLKDTDIADNLVENKELPLCSTYDIINGAYLEPEDSDSKIQWTDQMDDEQWTQKGFKIADEKQLQIISMALNSGMLNYGALNSDGSSYGYGADSRQRKGDYNYIGQLNIIRSEIEAAEAYEGVVKGDHASKFTDSYLWKYFSDDSTSKNILEEANSSGLNPVNITGESMILTYNLTGTEYDMSVFEMGFRGLGARYHCTEYESGHNLSDTTLLFKSYLVGSHSEGAHITLTMTVTKEMDSPRAGLLNEVPNTGTYSNTDLLIQNITLSGEVVNEGLNIALDASGNFYKQTVCYNAGGFMSGLVNKIKFENVKLDGLTVEATGYAGGLIGYVKEFRNCDFTAQDITLSNLNVQGGCDEVEGIENFETLGITQGHAGGLIGIFEAGSGEGSYDPVDVSISISDVSGDHVTVCTKGRDSSVGGFIGYIDTGYKRKMAICNSTLSNLKVNAKNSYYASVAGEYAGGIIGYSKRTTISLCGIVIGSEDQNSTVEIAVKEENMNSGTSSYPAYYLTYRGTGGFIGRYHATNGVPTIEIDSCKIIGPTESNGENTIIEGSINVGGIIGVADKANITKSAIQGVTLKSIGRLGGCIGYLAVNDGTESPKLNEVSVEQCHLSLSNPVSNGRDITNANDSGNLGGLIGVIDSSSKQEVFLTGCKLTNSVIAPDYSRVAGGFVGKAAQKISISSTKDEEGNEIANEIKDNLICGDIVGGVFGTYTSSSEITGISDITVSDNQIISYVWKNPISYQTSLAGGFAGKIETSATVGAIDKIIIENNLIAGAEPSNQSAIGGVVGSSNANTYFYDIKLKDNYIGIFEYDTFLRDAASNAEYQENTEDSSLNIQNYLKQTQLENLKEKLYAKTAPIATDTELKLIKDLTNIDSDDLYQYSYGLGAIAGKLIADTSRINTFIGINIQYTDNTYRPVSDVGMIETISSTEIMYRKYHSQYFIVYDSMNDEQTTKDEEYSGFSNLDYIYEKYQDESVDRRYAYRLDSNYISGTDYKDIDTIYSETYKKEGNYISDFVYADGNKLPLIVFRTSSDESVDLELDHVIQTYINILTNNSGALQTYDHQSIEVTTKQKVLLGGKIISGDGQTAVRVQNSGNKYTFVNVAEDGTRLYDTMTDEKNITFTVIEIEYKYGEDTKWVLEIPVYVEQELEFESHMRFMKGIEYNVSSVKQDGYSTTADDEKSYSLDTGDCYTLYLEYVYGEARTRYADSVIPKQLYMQSANEEKPVYFLVGTQLTLIDLEKGGKPYYYTVESEKENKIDFTKFISESDSDGDGELDEYAMKKIGICKEYDSFNDVCNQTRSNVAVESYLLLVDTSQVGKEERQTRGSAASYSLRTDISKLAEDNLRLYNRIEYIEHCYVRLSETPGFECEFVDDGTVYGEITEGGSVSYTMEYTTKISDAWKKANTGNSVYLDIAVSLEKTVNSSTQNVALPIGTQVYFEVQKANGEFERCEQAYVILGNGISDVYFYGDSALEAFNIMKLTPDTSSNTTVKIILDFSKADMSVFEDKKEGEEYRIAADLLIGTDENNPGNGDIRDSIKGWVDVNIVTELGFALQPDDLLTQGINRYQSGDTDTDSIKFKAQIAFPEDYDTENLKNKYCGIVYQIEEKTKKQSGIERPEYALYDGGGVTISKSGIDLTQLTSAKEYQYYLLSNENDLIIQNGIAEMSFELKLNEDLDFSNYRITGYLIISDSPIVNPLTEITNSDDLNTDFFVYTVAKIKTDLNINTDLTSSTSLN